MFEKFIEAGVPVKILFWLTNHSLTDYEASLVAYDCGIRSVEKFMTSIIILQELKMVVVDDDKDSLRIMLNDHSELVKKFIEFKELFDEEAYKGSEIAAAFISLSEMTTEEVPLQNLIGVHVVNEMLDEISEYKEIENKDDIDEKYLKYKNLDDEGQLIDFEEFLQKLQ